MGAAPRAFPGSCCVDCLHSVTWDFFVFLLALLLNCFRYYCSVFVNVPSSLCSVRAASTWWGPVRRRSWRRTRPAGKASSSRRLLPSRKGPGASRRRGCPQVLRVASGPRLLPSSGHCCGWALCCGGTSTQAATGGSGCCGQSSTWGLSTLP